MHARKRVGKRRRRELRMKRNDKNLSGWARRQAKKG
jgi:hypothetical protein